MLKCEKPHIKCNFLSFLGLYQNLIIYFEWLIVLMPLNEDANDYDDKRPT